MNFVDKYWEKPRNDARIEALLYFAQSHFRNKYYEESWLSLLKWAEERYSDSFEEKLYKILQRMK